MRFLLCCLTVFVVVMLVCGIVGMSPVAYAAEQEEIEGEMQGALERAEEYLDGIEIEPMKEGMAALGDMFTGLLSGAPAILMVTIAFSGLFMVLRKVLGR